MQPSLQIHLMLVKKKKKSAWDESHNTMKPNLTRRVYCIEHQKHSEAQNEMFFHANKSIKWVTTHYVQDPVFHCMTKQE